MHKNNMDNDDNKWQFATFINIGWYKMCIVSDSMTVK